MTCDSRSTASPVRRGDGNWSGRRFRAIARVFGLVISTGIGVARGEWSPVGPDYATIFALASSPHASNELLVGTFFGGLYRSADRGIHWSHVVSPFSSSPVFAIAYDPHQFGVLYAGTFGSGLFKSTDNGQSWTAQTNGLKDVTISDVDVDPHNPGVVLMASESGVFRSNDGGESWVESTFGQHSPNRASLSRSRSIKVPRGSARVSARTLAFDPLLPGLVYVGTRQAGTYRSFDGGQTWNPLTQGMGAQDVNWLGFSDDGSALYAATNNGVFRLHHDRSSWFDMTFDLAEAPVNQVLEHPIDGRLFAATSIGVFVLGDNADTWTDWTARPSRLLHIDDAGSPIYVASLGSEFVASMDNGASFFDVSNGIKNLFVGALATVATGGESVILGGSNNGVHVTSRAFEVGGTLPWSEDDGFEQAVFALAPHPTAAGTVFAGTEGAGVWKSSDWGITWEAFSDGIVPTRIFALAQSPVGNHTLYAATNAGLYVSRDDGSTWELNMGFAVSARGLDVLTDPAFPGVAYVSTDGGEVHKSIDDGRSFQNSSTGLPGDAILNLAAAPFGNVYAVTSKGDLYISFNEGGEWFAAGDDVAAPVLSVATDANNPFKAYVGTNGGGVYRSVSNGLTWEPANVGLDVPFVFALAVDPADGDVLYAGSVDTVFKSVNGGGSWNRVATGLPNGFVQEIIVDDDEPETVHAFVAGVGIYSSVDGGQNWAASASGAPFLKDVPLAISYATTDKFFAGSDVQGVYAGTGPWTPAFAGVTGVSGLDSGLRRNDSTFAGVTGAGTVGGKLSPSSDGMSLFVRGLAISGQDPDLMLAGSLSGGIFRSFDGGEHWFNRGLDDRFVLGIALDPHNDDVAYAATSLGVVKTVDAGESFLELGQKTSVIFTMVVDPSDRDVIYLGGSAGSVLVSRDAGLTWKRAQAGLPGANILALAMDPRDGTLFAAAEGQGIYRSIDEGGSWQASGSEDIGVLQVVSLTINGVDGTLYAAAGSDGPYRSLDGGENWEPIGNGFGGDSANQIIIHPTSNVLLVAASNEAGNFSGVSRSINGGNDWTNSSDGLATESVASLTIDPTDPAKLYAATAMGVYRSIDGGVTWASSNVGLETVAVTAVLADASLAGVLFAATHGSGVFRSLDGGNSWLPANLSFEGVEATSLASGKNPGTVYLGSLTNGFFRTVDGGDAWLGGIEPRLVEPSVTALAIHPQSSDIVYAAASGVGLLKTTNGGITWNVLGEEIEHPFILAIAIDPVQPNTVYVGTTGAGVWLSLDAGASWTPLNDGLFNLNVTSLVVDAVDSNVLYAGTEGGGIFMFDRSPPPVDTDGDGVFDQVDCAPDDPTLATLHTFYHDYDKDSFGVHRVEPLIPPDFNIELAVDVCELAPGLGLVPWTNDPWDFDGFLYIDTQLKGDRQYGVDFRFASENGEFPDEELIDLGPDATTLHILWSDIETSAGVFDGPQVAALRLANQTYSQRDLKVSLTVSPIVSGILAVPDDLRPGLTNHTIAFGDPAVVDRFLNLLTFIHAELPDVEVTSVQIGYEIDKLLADVQDADFWLSYIVLHRAALDHVKSLWGATTPVSSLWSADGFLNPEYDALRELLTFVDDVVSLTYFPHHDDFTIYEPEEIPDQLWQIAGRAFPQDIYFQAVGYPSAPITGSSTTKQSQFLYAFYEFWDQAKDQVRFASFGPLHDVPADAAAILANSPEFRDVSPAHRERLVSYLASLGLRTFPGNGEHKPAYNTLRNHAFDRAWFRDVERASRSFYMGFTQTPYDLPPDAPTQIEVFTWLRSHFVTDGDISLVHLDGGVPWVEALADDFTSIELPYSAGVRDTLRNDRDTIPSGNRIAVAINPLGVPRHLLAPYWGVGEGFDFDEDFNRVPNGIVGDADKRALPPPWDNYDFDSPEVRTAFLNYAIRMLDYFQPDYLIVGIEVSAALVQDQQRYEKYFAFHQWLYEALKANPAYAQVPIMVSFSSTSYMIDEFGVAYKFDEQEAGVREAQVDALGRMLPYTDIVGLSHYPHFGKYSAYTMPAMLYDELLDLLVRLGAGDKPIAITESGYTGDPFDILDGFVYTGTAEKQERYYRLLFRELARHANPVEFIVNFEIRDGDLGWQRQVDAIGKGTGTGSANFVEFLQFFRDIGIYDGDGILRPGGERWLEELALPLIPNVPAGSEVMLESPSNELRARFNPKRLVYSVERGGEAVYSSSMGLTVDGVDVTRNISQVTVSEATAIQQSFDTLGVHSFASTRWNAYTLTVQRNGAGDSTLEVEVRVYDDAFAYRYVIPGNGPRLITGESTSWVLPESSTVWYQDDAILYEGMYREGALGTFTSGMGGPVTARLSDGTFLVFAEANLGDYSGLSYLTDTGTPEIRAQFFIDAEWQAQGGTTTPWRVVLVSDDLDDLVNSDVLNSLNSPHDPTLFPQGSATHWIRPGRALYSIAADPASGFNLDYQKAYVDAAHALGFEYVVVGPGWEVGFPFYGFADAFAALANLVEYAHRDDHNVDVVVWKPYVELQQPATRDAYFLALANTGAAGVAIDASAAESQEFNQFVENVLPHAAAHGLIVTLANSGKPSGESRTYPNLLARDAVRGLEWVNTDEGPTPHHNAILPFTRFLAGSAEYKPVTLNPSELGQTTLTHQLATAGVFTAALQVWSVRPQDLVALPNVLDVVRAMRSTWDETVVLHGDIGQFVVMARRADDRWFLFMLNGSSEDSRLIELPDLTFLADGTYDAVYLADETSTTLTRLEQNSVGRNSGLSATLAPGGGFVAMFTTQTP